MASAQAMALIRSRALVGSAHDLALQMKRAGRVAEIFSDGLSVTSQLGQYSDNGANQRRYSAFRGWVHAAVNALAQQAAGQPVKVGKLAGKKKPGGTKTPAKHARTLRKMCPSAYSKAAANELEILEDHPLVKILEKPNTIQHRWQFVYSFVANLNLTGWGFIIGDHDEEGNPQFYSVPTTWIRPDHTNGPFAQFRLVNPKNPAADLNAEPFDRSQVTFAYLPNPADPMGALAPAQAQTMAIGIDDNIQSSQSVFFDNSVFPSAIVTIGKNPHPDVPGGIRPRLTPEQRRQVAAAIKKVAGGVANYGNPVIIDGMIESIERLSASQNEIGWEKSEKSVRTRILSAFCVHPFIMGEEMAGSYAQAYIVEDRFCQRVNVFLDLLSTVMTEFYPELVGRKKDKAAGRKKKEAELLIWWEKAEAKDPSMEKGLWEGARNRDDVSQNEFRAYMGLEPDEDKNESVINKSAVTQITAIATATAEGKITPEQAKAILIGMGLPEDLAKDIAGKAPPKPKPGEVPIPPGQPGGPPGQPGALPPGTPPNANRKPPPGGQNPQAPANAPAPPAPEEDAETKSRFETLTRLKTATQYTEDVLAHVNNLVRPGSGNVS